MGDGIGDITLWQWIKGKNPDEDMAWKDSWSVKRQEELRQKKEEQQQEESLKKKEKDFVNNADTDGSEEALSVLCQCGHIVHVPVRFEGKSIRCPTCDHVIHAPN